MVPPLLTINQEAITVEDILEPVRPRLERAAAKLARDEYYALLIQLVRQQLIDEISERLIYGEARREIGEEQDKAIEAAVDRIEQERINDEFAGRESRYEQYLADLKKSRADVRERLRRRVVVARYLRDRLLPRVSVRKRDLQKYYETHRSEFTQNRQVELFMIDVPFVAFLETDQPPTEAEKAAARRRARAHAAGCKAKIEAGATFEEVAREDSFGLHREEGGSWGFISAPLRGRYEIPSRVALGLDSGRVSDVIETDSGYFLVQAGRVVGGSTRRFEEVQAEITERLRQEQFAELRRDFVQRTLARAAVSDIEPFVRTVVARAPESGRAASGGSPRP